MVFTSFRTAFPGTCSLAVFVTSVLSFQMNAAYYYQSGSAHKIAKNAPQSKTVLANVKKEKKVKSGRNLRRNKKPVNEA